MTDEEHAIEDAIEYAKIQRIRMQPMRQSIAAARVSQAEIMEYQKPVYPKDELQAESLRQMLRANEKMQVLVGHRSDAELSEILNAFYAVEYELSEDIIRQGDEGGCLFIVAEGVVDIFVTRPGVESEDWRGPKICSLGVGGLFGELALMYNAPRAATVTAATNVVTWVLAATDFKMLLVQSCQLQYAKYEGWLSQVSLFQPLNHFELARLADTLENELYEAGEIIVQQGDIGDKFYIIEDGSAAAFLYGDDGEHVVKEYVSQGDYFGEVALLTETPRVASVRATGEGCIVASLTKENFFNILGPIAEKLKEHVSLYPLL